MLKKKIYLSVFIALTMLFSFALAVNNEESKKIVSIVYDDSGSMALDNNYCYSDYALQILTASLGDNDELNIVKMSNYYINNEINLKNASSRQAYIDEIKEYAHAGGTPFASVDTAKEWLVEKSSDYGDDAEYWLLVITDGAFAGVPEDMNLYMQELNSEFNNLNFEFILLSIGSEADETFNRAIKNSANSSVLEASDSKTIYTALMDIANLINSGATDKIAETELKGDKVIKLTSDYPLKKMMILTQNDKNYVKSVAYNGSSLPIQKFNVSYDTENLVGSLTHVYSDEYEYLNAGEYLVEFANNVSLENVTFLCEAFIEVKVSVVDENDLPLTNAKLNFLLQNSKVKVKCEIYNAANGQKIDIKNIDNQLDVQLINNKNKYNMKYNDEKQAYYTEITLMDAENNLYSLVEAKDLFRVKSNVILIDTEKSKENLEHYKENMEEIEIPYSGNSKYEKVSTFIFEFVNDDQMSVAEEFKLELIDLPKGVKVEYLGKEYENEDKIPMLKEVGKKYVLNFLSNKDYKETEATEITLKIISKDNLVYWNDTGLDESYLKLVPKAYPLKIVNENNKTTIDVEEEKLVLGIYRTFDDSKNSPIKNEVDVEDIKKIDVRNDFFSGVTYSVKKNEKDNVLEIKFTPNIFVLFNDKNTDVEFEVFLKNNIENGDYKENIKLTNINIWKVLRPYIIAGVLIIIALGYVIKPKFNKKSQLTVTEGSDKNVYALKPTTSTLLLPYVAHKAKIGFIEFKAGSRSDIVYSGKSLTILKIDGEDFEAYKESNPRFNVEKIVMKKDMSTVTIEAFDVVQKYEYLTKEVEFSDYDDTDFSDDFSSYEDEQF